MTLLRTIIPAASAVKALYDKSVFSYRGTSLRNRLNQEWASSTTHRRALNAGSRSISIFSSPRGRIWGIYPLARATFSLPTYPASRQRFWTCFSCIGLATRDCSKGSRETLSWRFAPLTTIDKGTPCSSTRMFLLLPFFSPIGWVRANRFLRQRCFNV